MFYFDVKVIFFRTMDLPCAHMIREMRSELQLKDVHEQQRIDTRSFSDVCDVNLDGDRDEIIFWRILNRSTKNVLF